MKPLPGDGMRAAGLLLLVAAVGCRQTERVGWRFRSEAFTGSMSTTDGRKATWEYYHNRNALAVAVVTSQSIIALTESGHLIRFDRDSLMPRAEKACFPPILCLTASKGSEVVYAADADGRLYRVEPDSLHLDCLGSLSGRPTWLGCDSRGRVFAIVDQDRPGKERFGLLDGIAGQIQDVSGGRTWPLTRPRSMSVWISVRDEIWIGSDDGEWGGSFRKIDLDTGQASEVRRSIPIHGLLEVSDGRIWAYGGLAHLSACEARIAELDGMGGRLLFAESVHEYWLPGTWIPRRPQRPIVHAKYFERTGQFVAISGGSIWISDTRLASWQEAGCAVALDASNDALTVAESVRVVDADDDGVICLTCRGLIRVRNGRRYSVPVPGQFAARQGWGFAADGNTILEAGYSSWNPQRWVLSGGQWQRSDAPAPRDLRPRVPAFDLVCTGRVCCRDGFGRTWNAGSSLTVTDEMGEELDLTDLPFMRCATAEKMTHSSSFRDGVLIGLANNAVALVRLEAAGRSLQ